jgi:hypothetical protein
MTGAAMTNKDFPVSRPRGANPRLDDNGEQRMITLRVSARLHAELCRYARDECLQSVNDFCVTALEEKLAIAKTHLRSIRGYWGRLSLVAQAELLSDCELFSGKAGYVKSAVPYVVSSDLLLQWSDDDDVERPRYVAKAEQNWAQFVSLWPLQSAEKQAQYAQRAFLLGGK